MQVDWEPGPTEIVSTCPPHPLRPALNGDLYKIIRSICHTRGSRVQHVTRLVLRVERTANLTNRNVVFLIDPTRFPFCLQTAANRWYDTLPYAFVWHYVSYRWSVVRSAILINGDVFGLFTNF